MKITFTSIILFFFLLIFSLHTTAQNVGIGISAPTNKLDVFSSNDTAFSAITFSPTPLVPAIYGYSNSTNINQIGILGTYNGISGYGAAIVGIGYNGVMPPASKDIGLYGSQRTGSGRALYVDGQAQIVDGNQGTGKILTSDINGTASWQKTAAAQHSFASLYSSSVFVAAANTAYIIPFDYEEYDAGGDFSNGIFTAPDTGVYHFDATVVWNLSSSSTLYYVESYFEVGDPDVFFGARIPSHTTHDMEAIFGGNFTQQISTDIHLNAGNTVKVKVLHNASVNERVAGTQGIFGARYSRFSGHKLY